MLPENLFLFRHGESEENVVFRAQDTGEEHERFREVTSVPTWARRLTKKGVEEGRAVGRWIEQWQSNEKFPRRLVGYVSHYVRAIETAGHVDLGIDWSIEARLGERSWGEQAYLTKAEQKERFVHAVDRLHADPLLWAPIGGESMEQAMLRFHSFGRTLERDHPNDTVVCGAHGELINGAEYILSGWLPRDLVRAIRNTDPRTSLINGRIVHYSRVISNTRVDTRYVKKRYIDPLNPDDPARNTDWISVAKPTFTAAELLELAAQYEHKL